MKRDRIFNELSGHGGRNDLAQTPSLSSGFAGGPRLNKVWDIFIETTMSIPEFVVGETHPENPAWIVRTAGPLLYAHVEMQGETKAHLHCGPSAAVQEISEGQLHSFIEEMLAEWAEQVLGDPNAIQEWDYSFGDHEDPDHLVCRCGRTGFTGVLRLATPRMWALPAEDPRMLASLTSIDAPTENAIEDTLDWWNGYIGTAEDYPIRQQRAR